MKRPMQCIDLRYMDKHRWSGNEVAVQLQTLAKGYLIRLISLKHINGVMTEDYQLVLTLSVMMFAIIRS